MNRVSTKQPLEMEAVFFVSLFMQKLNTTDVLFYNILYGIIW